MLGVQERLVKVDSKVFGLSSWKNKVCHFLMWKRCERNRFGQVVRLRTQSVMPIGHPSGTTTWAVNPIDWDSAESPGLKISKVRASPYTYQESDYG